MLVALTRIGASSQTVTKTLLVGGADPRRVASKASSVLPIDGPVSIELTGPDTSRFNCTMSAWLGSRSARDEAFAAWAAALRTLSELCRACGGTLVVPGVAMGSDVPHLQGDLHRIDVLSSIEEEVTANLLRTTVPVLIALAGRGIVRPGVPPDQIGSRWLSESRAHVASRYLASTHPSHLSRIVTELRRQDGVARLSAMDVFPSATTGQRSVTIRCLDAAPSLASTRAWTVLLSALALAARRRIRAGRRIGHEPQRRLEENRARAVAYGLRARLVEEDRRNKPLSSGSGPVVVRPAADCARRLLHDLATEFRNLEVGSDELAPLLLALEPHMSGGGERAILDRWAAEGPRALAVGLRSGLLEPDAGGPSLAESRRLHPGLTAALLMGNDEVIAEAGTNQGGIR